MKQLTALAIISLLLISGCSVRSISDSGYQRGGYYAHSSSNPLYKGELSEFDVLGIDPGRDYSEEEISKELAKNIERISMRKGDSLLAIQSGAMIPDQDMIESLNRYFSVSIFTGIPERDKDSNTSYSRALRFSAAKAGIEKVFVYWGVLEAGSKNLATKTVSWVPIVGWSIPDESQEMRIRLKVALIDVKTGQWELFVPETFQDSSSSTRANRAQADQEQVALRHTRRL